MKWIDIFDDLPAFNIPVLVCDELNSFVSMGMLIEINEDEEPLFNLMHIEKVEIDTIITHWMPLPEPAGLLNEL